jgi:hypothetical protein
LVQETIWPPLCDEMLRFSNHHFLGNKMQDCYELARHQSAILSIPRERDRQRETERDRERQRETERDEKEANL